MKDAARVKDLRSPAGLDNLLYSADTYFSCFADLALTSPVEYFREGQGSLMQCVITPAAPYMSWTNEAIAAETDKQVSNPSVHCGPLSICTQAHDRGQEFNATCCYVYKQTKDQKGL